MISQYGNTTTQAQSQLAWTTLNCTNELACSYKVFSNKVHVQKNMLILHPAQLLMELKLEQRYLHL